MIKQLENTTGSAITITDTGVTIPATSTYIIPSNDYALWAGSNDVILPVANGSIVVNDGVDDLLTSEGIGLLQGSFIKRDFVEALKVNDRLKVEVIGTLTDGKVGVSVADSSTDYLDGKVGVGSTKVTKTIANPGANETLVLDVDESQIVHQNISGAGTNDHAAIDTFITDTGTNLNTKIDKTTNVDNSIMRADGTTGDLQGSGVEISDTNDITGVNDLTVGGDLTVNGTLTSINSVTIEVVDANIVVNNGGTESNADTNKAGITVEMSDATDAVIGYDSTLTSKFKIGEAGSEAEIVDVSSIQTLTNKTIDVDNNTVSNIELDNLKSGVLDIDLSTVSASDDTVASAKAIKTYVDAQVSGATDTYENVSKNIRSWNKTNTYTGNKLTSQVITDGVDSITKTLSYTGNKINTIVLSGDTPAGIDLTKTLTYTGNKVTSITYS